MKPILKIKKLLFIKDYYLLSSILFFSVCSMFMDIFSIGILVPLFANLDKNIAFENEFLNNILDFFSFEIFSDIKYLSIIIISIFVAKNIVYLTGRYLEAKFCYTFFTRLSKNFFSFYLFKNYSFHINNNSAKLIRDITFESNVLSYNFMQPLISSLAECISLIVILTFLFLLNPIATVSILGFLIFIALTFNLISKKYLNKLGKQRQLHSGLALKELQQSFSNLREIIIYKAQNFFVEKYDLHNSTNANTGFKSKFIYSIPRSILEISVISAIIFLIFIMLSAKTSFTEIVLTLSIYVLSASRMMPAITKIFANITTFMYTQKALNVVNDDFLNFYRKNNVSKTKKFEFSKISLKNLSFKYPTSKNKIVNNINLDLKNNDKIGILGPSGSGKSTLINIMSGLIHDYKGRILINNKKIKNKNGLLNLNLGYVPQNSLTIDESIEENIRLGRPKIKRQMYNKILKTVELQKLNKRFSYNSNKSIGERGAKISGGQNQRVGIARALYNQPSVLILDEALNAIDTKTKNKILSNIFKLYSNKLIIIISHSKDDLKNCNKIFSINNGKVARIKY